jgi:hypothetical protein
MLAIMGVGLSPVLGLLNLVSGVQPLFLSPCE